jgi:hypothetical protein
MLRANVDDIIKNSPYSEPVGGFLFGFSSTFIGFGGFIIFLLVLYDYYRFNKNSVAVRVCNCIVGENEFVLPLYFRKNNIKDDAEITVKPELSDFIIPPLNVESVGFPLSPLSSGLKRRTVSSNNFGTTPTRIINPFANEAKDISNTQL